MSPFLRRGLWAAALSLVALAQAQPARPAPDPLDPQAAVPPARHRSAMADYRALAESPVGSWKQANERVNRIGGWRAYAREAAQQPASAPASAAHRH